MRKAILSGVCIVLSLGPGGCIDLSGASDLLPVGTPFVVRGTMTVGGGNEACLRWQAENGMSYYLYQDALLDNTVFDRITTPGVTSRLVVATRSDLPAPCAVDRIVQVTQALEILD